MSREIPKFRAWVKDLKEYRVVASIHYVLMNKEWTAIPSYVTLYGNKWADKDISRAIQDVVLEQSTGLKDKNGKEIYEGDIVEIGKYGKFQIIWNEWACKFDFDKIGKREREEPLLSQDWEQGAEIIGTIHENPELLGDEE